MSIDNNSLYKLLHDAWVHMPQAAIAEMRRVKKRIFKMIDPLFLAEDEFAEKLNEPESEDLIEHRDSQIMVPQNSPGSDPGDKQPPRQ